MKKRSIIPLLAILLIQTCNGGFWVHIWNNTKTAFLVHAEEQRPDGKTALITGHQPAISQRISPLSLSWPFNRGKNVLLAKKGERFGFFENNWYLIPPTISYDPKPYQKGHIVGGTIKALQLKTMGRHPNTIFRLPISLFYFKNRYIELKKNSSGGFSVRWYFGLSKGPWITIPPMKP